VNNQVDTEFILFVIPFYIELSNLGGVEPLEAWRHLGVLVCDKKAAGLPKQKK
jgi:hypothetical protein